MSMVSTNCEAIDLAGRLRLVKASAFGTCVDVALQKQRCICIATWCGVVSQTTGWAKEMMDV